MIYLSFIIVKMIFWINLNTLIGAQLAIRLLNYVLDNFEDLAFYSRVILIIRGNSEWFTFFEVKKIIILIKK
jgi:hypothetical protein